MKETMSYFFKIHLFLWLSFILSEFIARRDKWAMLYGTTN